MENNITSDPESINSIESVLNQNSQFPTPNKNIFKILFFIFLGLFLIVLSVLTYSLINLKKSNIQSTSQITPTSTNAPTTITNETSDWKTYENKEIGISFKYPPILNLSEKLTNGLFTITVDNQYGFIGGVNSFTGITVERGGGFYDTLGFSKIGNNIYRISPAANNQSNKFILDNKNIKKTYTNSNGVEIVVIKDIGKFNPGENEAYYNDYSIEKLGAIINTKSKKYPGLAFAINPQISSSDFLKILDSVKIENSANSIDITQDWKTYTDKTIGFSFKYPENITINTDITKIMDSVPVYMNVLVSKMSTTVDKQSSSYQFSDTAEKEGLEKGQSLGDITVKVVKLNNGKYVQVTTVLAAYDECDVRTRRDIIFYINDYKIFINYVYNQGRSLISTKYLTTNKNCGQEQVWKSQETALLDFYNGSFSNKVLQTWFNTLDQIIKTINF